MGFTSYSPTIGNAAPPLSLANGGTGGTTAGTALGGLGLTGGWVPADNGLLAATGSLDAAGTTTAALTAGTIYLSKLLVRTSFTATNIWYVVATAGSGTSTGSFVGLYSSAGTLLSSCADIAANLTTAAAYSTALTTPQALTAGTFVWCAFLCNLSVTQPSMRSMSVSAFATANVNLTAATARAATGSATGQTTLTAFTPSASALSGIVLWMGIS